MTETGQRGEQIAAQHLKRKGYHIRATNWRWARGEIDIVASYNQTLIFVEVRTRHARTTESAFASLTPTKQQRMVESAYAYLSTHDLPDETPWRVDVVAVALRRGYRPTVNHVEDALGW